MYSSKEMETTQPNKSGCSKTSIVWQPLREPGKRYYPKNPKVQGEINARVDELLQMGYIEHSKSVMVKKKTDKWRLCVDFRKINAKSIKDAYPMPRINYILDQLWEARYISSLVLGQTAGSTRRLQCPGKAYSSGDKCHSDFIRRLRRFNGCWTG